MDLVWTNSICSVSYMPIVYLFLQLNIRLQRRLRSMQTRSQTVTGVRTCASRNSQWTIASELSAVSKICGLSCWLIFLKMLYQIRGEASKTFNSTHIKVRFSAERHDQQHKLASFCLTTCPYLKHSSNVSSGWLLACLGGFSFHVFP